MYGVEDGLASFARSPEFRHGYRCIEFGGEFSAEGNARVPDR
jgi:hypothetical protein